MAIDLPENIVLLLFHGRCQKQLQNLRQHKQFCFCFCLWDCQVSVGLVLVYDLKDNLAKINLFEEFNCLMRFPVYFKQVVQSKNKIATQT